MMKKIFLLFTLLSFLSSELMAQAAGRVYRDDCYSNTGQTLYPGNYKKNQLSVGNDRISSVDVYNSNKYIRLFEHDNYGGEYRDIYSDMVDLNTIGFEDETSSIKVLPSYYGPVTSNEPVLSANILNGRSLDYISGTTFWIPRNQLNNEHRLHMQGVEQNTAKNRVILTGCGATSSGSGCTGRSYLLLFTNNGTFLDFLSAKRFNGLSSGASHPSSIQVLNNVFPVAVAEETGEDGPSSIEFYTIQNDQIVVVPGSDHIIVQDHIGTLAYSNINGNTYLFGGDWDSDNLYVWRANGENQTSGFVPLATNLNPENSILSHASIDENWGRYNSFWLGKLQEDGRVVLFASHSKFVDVWEIANLNSTLNLNLRKIHKREKLRGLATWATPQYFREGTAPIHRPGLTPEILAFPDDFITPSWSPTNIISTLFKFRYDMKTCNGFASKIPTTSPTSDKIDGDDDTTNSVVNSKLDQPNSTANSTINLSINPNPVSGETITVAMEGLTTEDQASHLMIFDFNGRLVREVKIQEAAMNSTRILDISNLDEGSYVVQLIGKNGMLSSEVFIKVND